MPGPFPGMDPYLESPHLWRGFHGFLISEISADLNAGLPAGLAANAEESVVIMPDERSIVPDIHFISDDRSRDGEQGGVAVLHAEADHGIVAAYPAEEGELFIAIRSVDNWAEVVTIIEILSPSNKLAGSEGQSAYLAKQHDTLLSRTNLMEIDLLRSGKHTVAAPKEQLALHGKWDCLIVVHRPTRPWHFEYWFNRLANPLPTVSVPLTPDREDFMLDLQTAFDRAYDKGPYKRRLNYSANPPVEMDAVSLAWIDSWLKEKGVRQSP